MIIIDYAVFLFILAAGCFFYIHHLTRSSGLENEDSKSGIINSERLKLESYIERRLYDVLITRGEYVRSQVPCGSYRIDLTLPLYKIAIECDGKDFHSTPEQIKHDQRKNRYLRKNGWKVLRFSGKSINGNMKGVITRIEKAKQ